MIGVTGESYARMRVRIGRWGERLGETGGAAGRGGGGGGGGGAAPGRGGRASLSALTRDEKTWCLDHGVRCVFLARCVEMYSKSTCACSVCVCVCVCVRTCVYVCPMCLSGEFVVRPPPVFLEVQ